MAVAHCRHRVLLADGSGRVSAEDSIPGPCPSADGFSDGGGDGTGADDDGADTHQDRALDNATGDSQRQISSLFSVASPADASAGGSSQNNPPTRRKARLRRSRKNVASRRALASGPPSPVRTPIATGFRLISVLGELLLWQSPALCYLIQLIA